MTSSGEQREEPLREQLAVIRRVVEEALVSPHQRLATRIPLPIEKRCAIVQFATELVRWEMALTLVQELNVEGATEQAAKETILSLLSAAAPEIPAHFDSSMREELEWELEQVRQFLGISSYGYTIRYERA